MISPPKHREWDDAEGLCKFIGLVRELAEKPVGIKFCLGDPRYLDELCQAIRRTGIAPDYIAVDGAEGGTGAAPLSRRRRRLADSQRTSSCSARSQGCSVTRSRRR